MPLVITAAPTDELLSVEDAKRHLRVMNGDLDDEIASLIRAARDYCEKFTQRTLRTTVTRTLKQNYWWLAGCNSSYYRPQSGYQNIGLKLPWPPLLTVTGITYYDTDNAQQTLGTGNYAVETSTDGGGRVLWTSTATIPSLYNREDAITVTYAAGYASIDSATAPLPPVALQAMKTKLTELWGAGTDSELKAAMEATDRLLGMVDWTGYA